MYATGIFLNCEHDKNLKIGKKIFCFNFLESLFVHPPPSPQPR